MQQIVIQGQFTFERLAPSAAGSGERSAHEEMRRARVAVTTGDMRGMVLAGRQAGHLQIALAQAAVGRISHINLDGAVICQDAIAIIDNPDLLRPLLNRRKPDGVLVPLRDQKLMTPLHYAAIDNDHALVTTLLAAGAPVAAMDSEGRTPLYVSSVKGNAEMCRRLLRAGGAVDDLTFAGMMPLHAAARKGHAEVCRLLLDHGADPNLESHAGTRALHFAAGAEHGSGEACAILIAAGADVHAKDRRGATAIHFAAMRGNLEAAKRLVEAGATVFPTPGKTSCEMEWGAKNRELGDFLSRVENKQALEAQAARGRFLDARMQAAAGGPMRERLQQPQRSIVRGWSR